MCTTTNFIIYYTTLVRLPMMLTSYNFKTCSCRRINAWQKKNSLSCIRSLTNNRGCKRLCLLVCYPHLWWLTLTVSRVENRVRGLASCKYANIFYTMPTLVMASCARRKEEIEESVKELEKASYSVLFHSIHNNTISVVEDSMFVYECVLRVSASQSELCFYLSLFLPLLKLRTGLFLLYRILLASHHHPDYNALRGVGV